MFMNFITRISFVINIFKSTDQYDLFEISLILTMIMATGKK